MSDLDAAKELLTAAGYTVVKTKSYLAAQERQRRAKCMEEYADERRESAERWARNCLDEERRIRERLTFVYGVARAHGATVDDLRQLPAGDTDNGGEG